MSVEIRATLEELKGIAQEQFSLNKKLKELRERKKALETKVIEYLEANDKPGLKLDNIIFLAAEKTTHERKKKADKMKDAISILENHGVKNAEEVLLELEATKKGGQSSVPVLKMKQAGLFA